METAQYSSGDLRENVLVKYIDENNIYTNGTFSCPRKLRHKSSGSTRPPIEAAPPERQSTDFMAATALLLVDALDSMNPHTALPVWLCTENRGGGPAGLVRKCGSSTFLGLIPFPQLDEELDLTPLMVADLVQIFVVVRGRPPLDLLLWPFKWKLESRTAAELVPASVLGEFDPDASIDSHVNSGTFLSTVGV